MKMGKWCRCGIGRRSQEGCFLVKSPFWRSNKIDKGRSGYQASPFVGLLCHPVYFHNLFFGQLIDSSGRSGNFRTLHQFSGRKPDFLRIFFHRAYIHTSDGELNERPGRPFAKIAARGSLFIAFADEIPSGHGDSDCMPGQVMI